MKLPLPRVLIPLILALLARSVHAEPPDERVNLREQCRRVIAGAYLKAFDGVRYSREYKILVTSQLKELETALVRAKEEFERRRKAAEKHEFDVEHARARDEAFLKLQSVESQIASYRELVRKATEDLARFEAEEARLIGEIKPVFRVRRIEDSPDGGYPFVLEYVSPCPKYRYLCALPKDMAAALLAIKVEGEVPEACQRYASMSRSTPRQGKATHD